ncbi:FtsK/SpoIIIE family DNA translocase [Iocasia frigidifontis]|uniref:FtsK/SpoIIIE family DNA translocase n=1 Tax=Iocasia fonsfrigidae TaxID=2682810 RepID=UPI002E7AC40F|nr:DNA translocase FtsK 4TM domain-containing protein [Iocasia fonsfrigidae]
MDKDEKEKEKEIDETLVQDELDMETIEKRKNEILGILMIAFGILSVISLFTSTTGIVGEKLSNSYNFFFGQGAFIIPLIFILWGITLIRFKGLKINSRLLGFIICFITLLTLIHTRLYPRFPLDYALMGYGGGLLGGGISWISIQLFGLIGTYIILFSFMLIGFLLWFNILLLSLIQKFKNLISAYFRRFIKKERNKNSELDQSPVEAGYYDSESSYEEDIFDFSVDEVAAVEALTELEDSEEIINQENDLEDEILEQEEMKDNIDNGGVKEKRKYVLPGIKLLKDSKHKRKRPGNKSEVLEETLESFGVDARVIKVNHGPTITRYEVQPASGVKVSKIVNLADDIALSLAAPGVRIEAPIPGKAAVGIEVPHMENITVRLRDILSSREFSRTKGKLSLALGMGIDGSPIIADLSQMPHLLVAGATGSGKSVCINTIIASILYKATPGEVKLLLIDPKKVELSSYQGLPHLFSPVVSDPKKASSVLKLVVDEMESRYELFSDSGTRGISSYNKKVEPAEKLPYIVVIIDELSDLMMVSANEVEDNICRLAQMARAAGIHLVIATQRPSVDVITGLIKANIPSRISFAVSSQTDSRTILDMGGAEKLLGKGDMLFAPAGTQKPKRVQGAFVDNEEINAIVDFVKNQGNPDYEFDLEEIKDVAIALDDNHDDLYEEAVKLVVNYRASISMLQRRLHIGHSRAARLIDQMEEDGIVGPYAGSKPRDVFIEQEDLEEFFAKDND